MTRWTRSVASVCVASALALGSCGKDGGPAGPQAGDLTLELTTPYTDDGAIVVAVTGPEIVDIRAGSSALTVHYRAVAAGARVAVFGDIASGSLLRIAVPDARQVSKYSASVIEVSDRANAVRGTLTGYRIKIN